MSIILSFYFLLLGLVFGSFFNVVGLRVPKGESIVRPPSHCTSCGYRLRARDLVPVFSYLFMRGRCRKCDQRVSLLYPAGEALTGLLFMVSFLVFGLSIELILSLLLLSLLMIILVSDLAYMIIPDKVLLFFGVCLLIYRLIFPADVWWDPYVGAVMGFSLLFLIAIISNGGMGGGDIKLFAVLGLALGWKLVLLAFFLSAFYGAVVGLVLMAMKKVKRGQPIPFGPFIVAGAITSFFFGESLLSWYLNSLL
ncbi:prepilin peptidase [Bacillus sp. FJAT-45037]|uniref:prepilin peptidase n=1 Tax=Bacillus sp. FJAT-45037 TaxID=2011007 RepID=UPI000C237794|nr:A24 family peptidase [Bacillus sp. FJAT-45037]